MFNLCKIILVTLDRGKSKESIKEDLQLSDTQLGLLTGLVNFCIFFGQFGGFLVEPDNLYFIHNSPELITGSIKINEELYWGGDFEKVIELLNNESIGEENIRFFLGYSGWGENQLQNEIELNSWVIQENCIGNKVININSESFWRKQIRSLGGAYLIWGNAPENPSHN